MAEPAYSPLVPLDGGHDRTAFDCGTPALNLYLRNYALQNQKRGIVRNYVTTHPCDKVIVAYYSLVYASISQKLLPAKQVKGLGKYDVPVMLLARLAVDQREKGKGLSKALLKDAILRTMQAAEIAGLKLFAGACQGRGGRRLLPQTRIRAGTRRSAEAVLAGPAVGLTRQYCRAEFAR